jgi:uncharacterized phage protein (TIGR02216 family)
MAVGLGLLRLSPREFWAMSLPELQAASEALFGPSPAAPPMSREKLEELMRAFPD